MVQINKKLLLVYSTTDGHTLAIMKTIAERLTQKDSAIVYDLYDIKEMSGIELAEYDAVLMGASIRYGHFNKVFLKYLDEHYTQLNKMKTAFFGVNLVARKAGKDTAETNSYCRKFLESTLWKPMLKTVFAGALCYEKYTWYDKLMIRLIMRLSGDKQKAEGRYEYTNWQKVDEFADAFYQLVF